MNNYIVTYRDTYGALRNFTVVAESQDDASNLAEQWKGSAPCVSIVSVREAAIASVQGGAE